MQKNYEFTDAESKAKINGVYKYINFRPGHLATAGPGSAFHTWLVHTHRSFPKPWFVSTQLLPALIKTTQIFSLVITCGLYNKTPRSIT